MQEEKIIKRDKIKNAYLVVNNKDKKKNNKRKKDKKVAETTPYKKHTEQSNDKGFFYGAAGHKKKQCTNFHAWRAKNDTLLNLVYSEVNLTSVPIHMWWTDSSATTHISVSMQGYLSCQKPIESERYIYMGDDKSVEVEVIEIFKIIVMNWIFFGFEWDINCTVV